MRPDQLLPDLEAQGLLSAEQAAALAAYERTRPFSVHYELRAILYFGIVLLSGGLGVLVYQHIDQIGHGVVVGFIALVMLACFAYAARHRPPFTWGEAPRAGLLPDYLLLLGCLTFLILEGYLQYQYNLFGTRYGLATILPALLFFPLAYAFDHRGVLTLALTALAAWVGVSTTPRSIFTEGDFSSLSAAGPLSMGLGVLLIATGLGSERWSRKPHFAFTYLTMGSNLALLTASSLLFSGYSYQLTSPLLLVLLIFVLSAFLVWYARRTQSYLFLLLGILYSYAALTYLFFTLVVAPHLDSEFVMLALCYFVASGIGVLMLFLNIRKILRISGN